MDSINAKLFVCGEERELKYVKSGAYIKIRENGKKRSGNYAKSIEMIFESQMYDDAFIEWMLLHRFGANDPGNLPRHKKLYDTRDGKIVFYKEDNLDIPMYEYSFKDAVPVFYEETFDNQKGSFVRLHIASPLIDFRFFPNKSAWDVRSLSRYLNNGWQESHVPLRQPDAYRPVEENRLEKKITDYYLTDADGSEIEGYDIGDLVILNITTKNRIGDIITINLNDKDYDFEYDGTVLVNDTLKNIKIESDLEQIQLKIVPQAT